MTKSEQIEELQELLRDDPENYRARRELAMILIDSGFPKEASQHLVYLITKFPDDSDLHYNLGIAYEKQNLYNRAKESYLKSIELSPQNYDAIYNLGLVYTELKDYDSGIDCFLKILEYDNNDSNSYFNLGICYLKKGDLVKAIEHFQKQLT